MAGPRYTSPLDHRLPIGTAISGEKLTHPKAKNLVKEALKETHQKARKLMQRQARRAAAKAQGVD
jgi:uncharacterized membrane protein